MREEGGEGRRGEGPVLLQGGGPRDGLTAQSYHSLGKQGAQSFAENYSEASMQPGFLVWLALMPSFGSKTDLKLQPGLPHVRLELREAGGQEGQEGQEGGAPGHPTSQGWPGGHTRTSCRHVAVAGTSWS